MMSAFLKRTWWSLLARGIIAIAFGVLLVLAPRIALTGSVLSFLVVFSVYAIVYGGSTAVGALMNREGQWRLLLAFGLASFFLGWVVLLNPVLFGTVTLRVMTVFVALVALISGVFEIVRAWRLRNEAENKWLMVVSGVLAIIFGLLLLRYRIDGIRLLVLFTSFYLLIQGVVHLALAFQVRFWSDQSEAATI